MEDLRQVEVGFVVEVEPVIEVVTKVVAEEGPHGKRVVHHYFSCKKKSRNYMIIRY